MAAIRVSVDGVTVTTVNTEDFRSVDVHVSGNRTSPEYARLTVSAAGYVEGKSTYVSWDEIALNPDQTTSVSFDEDGATQPRGLPFFERYSVPLPYDEKLETREETAARIRSMPSLRSFYKFAINGPTKAFSGETQSNDHGFLFIASWHNLPLPRLPAHLDVAVAKMLEQQRQLRVRLSSATVENIENGTASALLFEDSFPSGGRVDLKLS